MTKEEKRIKELFEKYTPEELAESFVFPVKQTKKQREASFKDLAEHRKAYWESKTPEELESFRKEVEIMKQRFIDEDKN